MSSHKMLEIRGEMNVEQLSYFLLNTSDINIGVRGTAVGLWERRGLYMSGAATAVVS